MSVLYNRIMELCKAQNITGYRLCKDIGLTPAALTDLKMGRKKELSAKNADKIATYFGVSVGYLLGTETEKAPIPEDERQKELDRLAAEIRYHTRVMKTVVDSTYNFYSSLRELAKMDDPIPRYIALNPKQESDIQSKIAALVEKFMKNASTQEKSDFLSELVEIEEEFRRQIENSSETPYPTPEEIEAYGEMAENFVMEQFSAEEKPDAPASSAKESDVG